MLNSRQVRKALFCSLITLIFAAYPVLAQGEKIVELDETTKFVEIALIVTSALVAINTLQLLVAGVAQIGGGNSGFSALFPSILTSLFGVTIILLAGLIIGHLTPILIALISLFCAVIVATLMVALVHP